jgi:hypothetical protein
MSDVHTLYSLSLDSDACFGAAKLSTVQDVDLCTQVDRNGFPYIGGRILKGLIDESVAVLLRALGSRAEAWFPYAEALLGRPGGDRPGALRISDASWPRSVRDAISREIPQALITRALTEVRAQTRMDEETGGARDGGLRSTRVLPAGTRHLAGTISYLDGPLDSAPDGPRALLMCALPLVERAGSNRQRGWGRVRIEVDVDRSALQRWRSPILSALRGGGK